MYPLDEFESGMLDLISYELFMKNVTNGDSDFSLYQSFENPENYIWAENISVNPNEEYFFKYRAVNYIGPGPNSTE